MLKFLLNIEKWSFEIVIFTVLIVFGAHFI